MRLNFLGKENLEKNMCANIRKQLMENKNELRNLFQFKSRDNVTVIKLRSFE